MLTQYFYTPNTCAGCQRYGELEPYTVTDQEESVTVWLHNTCLGQLKANAPHLKIEQPQQYIVVQSIRPSGTR